MAKTIGAFLIVISAICVFLSAAPFTPAVFMSLCLMCIAGIYGVLGWFQTSLLLLLFTSLAVVASPAMDIGTISLWIILVPYILGFGGTIWGASKKALVSPRHNETA